MDQAFHPGLQLHEGAVLHQADDLALDAGPHRIAPGDFDPGIGQGLLDAQGDLPLGAVELEHLGRDRLARLEQVGRLADAPPGEVGDMQQSVDAAQVHEGAVIGDVLDHALDDLPFLEFFQGDVTTGRSAPLRGRTTGQDDVVPLLVELDDLEGCS